MPINIPEDKPSNYGCRAFPKSTLNLLVVLSTEANKNAKESGFAFCDVEAGVKDLAEICLFNYGDGLIALPFEIDDRQCVLLMKQIKPEENHFLCVKFLCGKLNLTDDSKFCHPLADAECVVRKDGRYIDRFYVGAVDHAAVRRDVAEKEKRKLFVGDSIEEQKWHAYFDLYGKILDEQRCLFSVKNIRINKAKVFAVVDEDVNPADENADQSDQKGLVDKLVDARGETIDVFIGKPSSQKRGGRYLRGQLKHAGAGKNIEIELEKGETFLKILPNTLQNAEEEDCDCEYVHQSEQPAVAGKAKDMSFYQNGEHVFDAKAVLVDEKESTDGDKGVAQSSSTTDEEDTEEKSVYKVVAETVKFVRLYCAVDFIGDQYQLGVMKRNFEKVKKMPIWQVFSGERVAKLPESNVQIAFDNDRLNEEQKNAVRGALSAPELFLIWGPPGTGKTEVIKEIAKQEALRGNKTLITSQANLAVDNALARLDGEARVHGFRVAKKDHKMEGEDKDKVPFKHTSPLFFLKIYKQRLAQQAESELRRHILTQIEKSDKRLNQRLRRQGPVVSDHIERESIQLGMLYKHKINVVGATLMESGRLKRKGDDSEYQNALAKTTGIKEFDTVIIDEVSKATPPELFIPIPMGKRLILVGDHKQLPPMFKIVSGDDKTQEEWAKEVGVPEDELDIDSTIFERLWDRHVDDALPVRAMLTKQYRMHENIQGLITPFYEDTEGTLELGLTREQNSALLLKGVDFFENRPAMWVGTQSESEEERVGTSFINEDEIKKAGQVLRKLAAFKDDSLSVGVITFYGAQLRELKDRYENRYARLFGAGKLVFGTVDRFQGRECDVIICSLVRNNHRGYIGFATKPNRINVAFSRARRALIILGHKETFCSADNQVAQNLYNYVYSNCKKPKPKELK